MHEYSTVDHLMVSGCPRSGNIIVVIESKSKRASRRLHTGYITSNTGATPIKAIKRRLRAPSPNANAGDILNTIKYAQRIYRVADRGILLILIYNVLNGIIK